MPEKSKTDPLIKDMRKVYRSSNQARWDELLASESRWKRKLTIAQNKLADLRVEMNCFTQEVVRVADGNAAPVVEPHFPPPALDDTPKS